MPTVANTTPFDTLLPASAWEPNPAVFARETERNEGFDATIAWPGFGSNFSYELPNVGVVSRFRLLLEASTVTTRTDVAGNDVVLTDQWPHGLIRNFTLRVNGQAAPWNCRGVDLNVLRQARYKSIDDSPVETAAATATGTGGTTPLRVQWDVPLALDPAAAPNVGGLFLQSTNSQVTAEVVTAPAADVVRLTGDATLDITSGGVRPLRTWYAIPSGKLSNGQTGMIVPDISVLHGLLSQEQPVTGTGESIIDLNRLQGSIGRMWWRVSNGPTADSLDPVADFERFVFMYASNQRPRVYDPYHLAAQNVENYRGLLPYAALAMDQLAENLQRDAIQIANLSDPQLVLDIASGTTVNAGARIVTSYELITPLG